MMQLAAENLSQVGLDVEWARVELLSHCLLHAHQGKAVGEETLAQLRLLQDQVQQLRCEGGPWQRLNVQALSPLEMDVLVCILASEAQPRLGWLYQSLQPGTPQPYATPALLQSLLALEGNEVAALHMALDESGPLRSRGLIEFDGQDPLQPIRPARNLVARLQGRTVSEQPPPGAVRVRQQGVWDNLVLPDDRLRMLHEFLLWIRHRHTVVDNWGGQLIGGPIALFSGPSGTGKTYAAAVIAAELGWPLFRVDLGRLVSKYIGETEKNLNRLFDAAHGRDMVLQFDEANSLMSKRGEVKEARDRYANMEVSHLLARIEEHQGPCVLTTNLRSHLDQAFYRRFQMVVEFPRPDTEARVRLWARLLPPRAPRRPEVVPEFLGEAVNLTGSA